MVQVCASVVTGRADSQAPPCAKRVGLVDSSRGSTPKAALGEGCLSSWGPQRKIRGKRNGAGRPRSRVFCKSLHNRRWRWLCARYCLPDRVLRATV